MVQTINLLIMQFLLLCITSFLLVPNIFLSTLFSKTPPYVPPSMFHTHTEHHAKISSVFQMTHELSLMILYEKYDQQVHI